MQSEIQEKIVEAECQVLKEEYLLALNIPESQLSFDCKLSADGKSYTMEVTAIPTEDNPLPPDLKDKVKEGITLPNLGVKTKPVNIIKEKSNLKIYIIIAVIVVILIILGGLFAYFSA